MSQQRHGYRIWTAEEDAFLLEMVGEQESYAGVAAVLGRSPASVKSRMLLIRHPDWSTRCMAAAAARNAASLAAATHSREVWEGIEDELVMETYDEPLADVAEVLGRSVYAVSGRRYILRNGLQTRGSVAREGSPVARSATPSSSPVAPVAVCPSCFLVHATRQTECER